MSKIFLIGMMGSGKTTLAKMISKILSIPYIDTDEEIEKSHHMEIKEIFEKKGEIYFRKLENQILESLLKIKEDLVVSTGGGIILNPKNRELLKNQKTLYLKVDPIELKNRVSVENRPLLLNNKEKILEIYNQRKELYEIFETLDITSLNEWEATAKILYTLNIYKKLEIDSSFQRVHIQMGALKLVPKEWIIFTNEKVNSLYGNFFPNKKFIFPNGERVKDISYVSKAYEQLLENNVSRKDFLCGIGGGTITDFTGFVASTYKRGMNFTFYPTTLLAQIDASIGGKNGIDFKKYKNVVGTINLPNEVIIDPLSLLSLDEETYREGLIEGYKMALIAGRDFYSFFKENLDELLNRNLEKLSNFIKWAVEEKLRIVEEDFKDTGLRSFLNLGHTLGHAFEASTGIAHGLSVGWGLLKELELFKKYNLTDERCYQEIKNTLEYLVSENIRNIEINKEELFYYIINDKKADNSKKIKIPILKSPGNVTLEEIDYSVLKNSL